MQALYVVTVLFALGDQKDGLCRGVDHRCAGDANLRIDISGTALHIGRRHRGGARGRSMGCADHARLPQRRAIRAAVAIGVKRVHGIVLIRNKEDVVRGSVDGQVADVERLRVHLAIHTLAEKLAKCIGVDIGRRKNGFLRVLALVGIVIPPGKHVGSLRL